MFLLLTKKVQWKTKDVAKIISNLPLNCEKLGTAIFKEHFLVAVFVMNNFHWNLPFLF